MHVTLVHVDVDPNQVDAFIAATQKNHEASIKEPGNRRFDVLQDPENRHRFILYEAYACADDAAAHKQTPHYHAWREAVADMMNTPRKGVRYDCLFPNNDASS